MALGQQGNRDLCGSGGSFVTLDGDGGPEPLLVAAGAGRVDCLYEEFGRGNLSGPHLVCIKLTPFSAILV